MNRNIGLGERRATRSAAYTFRW